MARSASLPPRPASASTVSPLVQRAAFTPYSLMIAAAAVLAVALALTFLVNRRESAREPAFHALKNYRDGGCVEPARPAPEDIIAAMNYITGTDMAPQEVPFLREELNLFGEDGRRVPIDTSAIAPGFRVLVPLNIMCSK